MAEIAQAATVVRTKRSRLSRARIVDWAFIVLAGLGAALFAIPLIFMFSSSLRPLGDAIEEHCDTEFIHALLEAK